MQSAPEGHPAVVRNRKELANGLFTFSLDPPAAVRGTFHTPGQYHRLAVEGVGESYFAMASAPTASLFDYLARAGSSVADALIDGAEVTVTAIVGPGFPLQAARGYDVLLVATGTGIAPIRSVIETLLPQRSSFGRVQLVYGARTQSELAFSAEFESWSRAGIGLHLTLSAGHAAWSGEVGRVQQRLTALELAPGRTFAFLCGQNAMELEVTERLQSLGLATQHICVNH